MNVSCAYEPHALLRLPTEIVLIILSSLDWKSIVQMAMVDDYWCAFMHAFVEWMVETRRSTPWCVAVEKDSSAAFVWGASIIRAVRFPPFVWAMKVASLETESCVCLPPNLKHFDISSTAGILQLNLHGVRALSMRNSVTNAWCRLPSISGGHATRVLILRNYTIEADELLAFPRAAIAVFVNVNFEQEARFPTSAERMLFVRCVFSSRSRYKLRASHTVVTVMCAIKVHDDRPPLNFETDEWIRDMCDTRTRVNFDNRYIVIPQRSPFDMSMTTNCAVCIQHTRGADHPTTAVSVVTADTLTDLWAPVQELMLWCAPLRYSMSSCGPLSSRTLVFDELQHDDLFVTANQHVHT